MNVNQKEQRFKELLSENQAMIYRLCYAYLYHKDEVDDLFQEVMLNIWSSLEKFRGDAKISTWIYRIAINTALIYNKKKKKDTLFFKDIAYETYDKHQDDYGEVMEKEENLLALRKAIAKLKKQDRIIITLLLEGLKYEEIAEIIGISLNHTGVKINRVKAKLFKILSKNENQ